MKRLVHLFALGVLATGGCDPEAWRRADAMRAGPIEPLGEDRLSLHWKFVTADRLTEIDPQEFAAPAVYADTLFIGSASGWFFALRASTGAVRWRQKLGAVASAPIVIGGLLIVGGSDGTLHALDAQTGTEKWHYQSRGPIEQPPVATGDLVVFSNEADQVVAVDSSTVVRLHATRPHTRIEARNAPTRLAALPRRARRRRRSISCPRPLCRPHAVS